MCSSCHLIKNLEAEGKHFSAMDMCFVFDVDRNSDLPTTTVPKAVFVKKLTMLSI